MTSAEIRSSEGPPQSTSSNHVPYTDALRVAGAYAVIIIHVVGDGTSSFATLSIRSWWCCVCIEALSRWAVPIFVMVSGSLLLDPNKSESPGQFYRKRLRRLAIPAAAWSLFYLAWRWLYEGDRFSFGSGVYQYISGGAYYHLWFLSMLLGLYLATPILRIVVRGLTRRQLWWTTGTVLVLGIGDAIAQANVGADFSFLFQFCPYIGLFLLGYCLRFVHRTKSTIVYGAMAWILGAAICAVGTYVLVFHCATGTWDTDNRLFLVEDEFSPGVLIMSVGVYNLFAAWYEVKGKLTSGGWVQTLSAASLGIYLSHPLTLSLLNGNDIAFDWHGVAIGIPVMIAIAASGSTILSLIMKKVPWVREVV